MSEDIVWLYKVLDTEKMSAEELKTELDRWSKHITPHELIQQGDKLIIKYQSALNRKAFFEAATRLADITIQRLTD